MTRIRQIKTDFIILRERKNADNKEKKEQEEN
jgi:hypothetical protein